MPEKTDDLLPPERMLRLQEAFAAHLRDPERCPPPSGLEERRMAIYRRLFFGNLRNLIARNFPVLKRLLDDSEWDQLIRQLMVEHRSTTPLFPEIGSELLAFIAGKGQSWLDARPWMAELIHWEYLETLARLHEAEVSLWEELPLERSRYAPVLNPTLQLGRYRYPVHQIRPAFIPSAPLEEPINLLVFRRYDDQIGFERVNDMALRLLLLMQSNPGTTGLVLLQLLAEELSIEPKEHTIENAWSLLKHLSQQGVIAPTLSA